MRLAALKYGLTVRSTGGRAGPERKLTVRTPGAEAAVAGALSHACTRAHRHSCALSVTLSVCRCSRAAVRQWIGVQRRGRRRTPRQSVRLGAALQLHAYAGVSSDVPAAPLPRRGVFVLHLPPSYSFAYEELMGPRGEQVLQGEGAQQRFRQSRNNGIALLALRCASVADASKVAAALVPALSRARTLPAPPLSLSLYRLWMRIWPTLSGKCLWSTRRCTRRSVTQLPRWRRHSTRPRERPPPSRGACVHACVCRTFTSASHFFTHN